MATKSPKFAKPESVETVPGNPFEAFTMAMPSADVPVMFRDFAEKSVAQARDAYAKMKTVAEQTTDMVEDAYESAREGAFAMGVKAIDAAKTNSDASFAFARDLFGAKTLADVIELQTTFARKQFDAVTVQVKEFQQLAQKVATDAAKPVTAQVEKTFKEIKAA